MMIVILTFVACALMCFGAGIFMLIRGPFTTSEGKGSIKINFRLVNIEVTGARQGIILIVIGAVMMLAALFTAGPTTTYNIQLATDIINDDYAIAAADDIQYLDDGTFTVKSYSYLGGFDDETTPRLLLIDRWSSLTEEIVPTPEHTPITPFDFTY